MRTETGISMLDDTILECESKIARLDLLIEANRAELVRSTDEITAAISGFERARSQQLLVIQGLKLVAEL